MRVNAEMGPAEVRAFCEVDSSAQPLLRAAAQWLQFSARAFHRVLKLARTIADLAGAETVAALHLAETQQYRPRVEVGWRDQHGADWLVHLELCDTKLWLGSCRLYRFDFDFKRLDATPSDNNLRDVETALASTIQISKLAP